MRYGSIVPWAALVTWLGMAAGCGQTDTNSRHATAARSSAPTEQAKPNAAPVNQGKYEVRVASAHGRAATREDTSSPKERGEPNTLPTTSEPLPLEDMAAEAPTMPQVVMSEAHAKLCKVRVGDAFPDVELADLDSQPRRIAELLGKKLTVVAFWNARQPMALDELAELGPRFQQRFADDGLAVIGINAGDDAKLAKEVAEHAHASFVNLSDADRKALAAVGEAKLPRTYLLDAQGKIVWFDIEFSRTTRRELTQAIRYLVEQP